MTRHSLLPTVWIQRLIGLPFLVLGAWCLFMPGMVERLSFQPDYRHESLTSAILIGCFGAQALIAGAFATFSRFTKWTFAVYGAMLLPFFGFNYYFAVVLPVFTPVMLLDFGANLFMLVLCAIGWRRLSRIQDPGRIEGHTIS